MLRVATSAATRMLTMSTRIVYPLGMPVKRKAEAEADDKAEAEGEEGAYHHGDLERALVDAAVSMIREQGVQAFTLRSVGARVGVSRTALYRHFDDKAALLARVASEGFRRLHAALATAIATASQRGADPLQAMAAAYVHFAADNPSHYQTMFGGFLTDWNGYPDLITHGDAAFNILVETIRGEQERGKIGPGDPIELAEITWSLSHGIATLGMARHLARPPRASRSSRSSAAGSSRTAMRLEYVAQSPDGHGSWNNARLPRSRRHGRAGVVLASRHEAPTSRARSSRRKQLQPALAP